MRERIHRWISIVANKRTRSRRRTKGEETFGAWRVAEEGSPRAMRERGCRGRKEEAKARERKKRDRDSRGTREETPRSVDEGDGGKEQRGRGQREIKAMNDAAAGASWRV